MVRCRSESVNLLQDLAGLFNTAAHPCIELTFKALLMISSSSLLSSTVIRLLQ